MERHDIAQSAAKAVQSLSEVHPALIGFDGFIDSILHMVDVRADMSPTGYTRLRTITDFATRCAGAAGKSTNIEQVLIEDRFGGNGPLMASAVASLEIPVTYIGAVGQKRHDGDDYGKYVAQIDPVFAPFAKLCERVYAVAPPSNTDCLEFDDGKLMFNNTQNVQEVTWERIVECVGLDALIGMVERSRLIGIVNWSLLGGVPGIWHGLARDVLPKVSAVTRRLSLDLSDPAKRTDRDIGEALEQIRVLQRTPNVAVTLGLNLAESQRIAKVLGLNVYADRSVGTMASTIKVAAEGIRAAMGLDTVVIHPREGAAAADKDGNSAWFDGPFTSHPKLSTGAGDHFNGGFAFAQMHGLELPMCLAVACATSGAYVRDAKSPSRERLISFLEELPAPE